MFPWYFLIFLKRSVVFPILLFSLFLCIDRWGRLSYLFLLFFNSAFRWIYLCFSSLPFTSLLFSAICKASSDNHFAFWHFFFLVIFLITASCTMSQTFVHSSLDTLSDLIPWIYLSLPLYNRKGFDLGYTWMVYGFPYFLHFKSEFSSKEFRIWATVSSWPCFCWLYRAAPCGMNHTCVPCIGGWILSHWPAREVPSWWFWFAIFIIMVLRVDGEVGIGDSWQEASEGPGGQGCRWRWSDSPRPSCSSRPEVCHLVHWEHWGHV